MHCMPYQKESGYADCGKAKGARYEETEAVKCDVAEKRSFVGH